MKTISPSELKEIAEREPVILIDVRTPVEFREVHVEYARNIPLDRLDPQQVIESLGIDRSTPIYLICKGGKRGQTACEKFVAAGFENVVNIEGGTEKCLAENLPVVHGKKSVSLERQVRIAAGFLVFASVIIGYTVHPWAHAIAGAIGAGLVFGGITDTCAMGMLVAKMPWNRVSGNPACTANAPYSSSTPATE